MKTPIGDRRNDKWIDRSHRALSLYSLCLAIVVATAGEIHSSNTSRTNNDAADVSACVPSLPSCAVPYCAALFPTIKKIARSPLFHLHWSKIGSIKRLCSWAPLGFSTARLPVKSHTIFLGSPGLPRICWSCWSEKGNTMNKASFTTSVATHTIIAGRFWFEHDTDHSVATGILISLTQ